ncbi:2-phospho-L-lactate transferase CofD family protein, partial [Staphylococcus warneri]|uniref:2-phospho-L-lactate transferase CofD family protein n=1 Tax=Staphylococcus warneri TaxID=1292 RepID=UPI0011A1E294
QTLEQTDLILLPPPSLYTTLISNLSLKRISHPLLNSSAPKLYLSNLITHPPQTDGYHVKQHINPLHPEPRQS